MNDIKTRPQFTSVPFKASSSNGMTEYNGIAKFSRAGVVLEFDSVVLGLIGGDVKEVRVALDEILDIRFRKGFYKFFAQIQFRLNSFAKISQLPNQSGKVKLNVKREDYELAQRAVEQMRGYLSEIDSNEQLPPAPGFVSDLFETDKLESGDARKTKKLGE